MPTPCSLPSSPPPSLSLVDRLVVARSRRGHAVGLAFAVVCGLALCPSGSAAHEFYLRPSKFLAAPGERVGLALEVGHAFAGQPVERRPGHLRRFVAVDALGESREVRGVDGALPAGWLLGAKEGLVTVSYESHAMRHDLSPGRFESYLHEEGLEAIVARRDARGEAEVAGRELFSRCAKALVLVGQSTEGSEMPVVGCPLELVPGAGVLETGAAVSVRVLWQGVPLAGALVRATRAGDLEPLAAARSDGDGRVTFALGAGAWLVHTVHMVEVDPAAEDGARADWRSVWSSLTFERRSE